MKSLLTVLFLVQLTSIYSQEGSILSVSEEHLYDVQSLEKYISFHTVEFIVTQTTSIGFSIREGCQLKNLSLEKIKKGEWKKQKTGESLIKSTISSGSFFSGVTNYILAIEDPGMYRLSTNIEEVNSIFISHFSSDGYYESAEVKHTVKLPKELNLTDDEGEIYGSTVHFNWTRNDSLEYSVHTLIHPKEIEAQDYFNGWFGQQLQPLQDISESDLSQIVDYAGAEKGIAQLAAIFEYVQNKIRYIDIENGINAIVPRSPHTVLSNGYGDCKDMAYTLQQVLKTLGYDAYWCISRTNSMDNSFDFTSLAMANHSICAVRVENKWFFLDATEKHCRFGEPSLQTYGTEVFMINESGGQFQNIPSKVNNKKLEIAFTMDFEKESLEVEMIFSGGSDVGLRIIDDIERQNKLIEQLFPYPIEASAPPSQSNQTRISIKSSFPEAYITNIRGKTILKSGWMLDPDYLWILLALNDFPVYDLELNVDLKFVNANFEKANWAYSQGDSTKVNQRISIHVQGLSNREEYETSELKETLNKIFKQNIILYKS